MNFPYLLFPLIGLILGSNITNGAGGNNFGRDTDENDEAKIVVKEDYKNSQFITRLVQRIRGGVGKIEMPSLMGKFINRKLYYHGYSDDEIIMLIEKEEDLSEFLIRVLIKELLIDIYRGREEANPHLISLIKDLKNCSLIATDLYNEEFIEGIEEIYNRNTIDELNDYVVLFKEKLYYEAFVRNPDIDFKRVLRECDDYKFRLLDNFFFVLDGFNKCYKYIFPEGGGGPREIFSRLKIDRLWELKDHPGIYKKALPFLLEAWIEINKRAITYKLSISPTQSKAFVYRETRDLQRKERISKIIRRFSKFLQELKRKDLEFVVARITENDISNLLTSLLNQIPYDEYLVSGEIFRLGFKYLASIDANYTPLRTRNKRINFYLCKTTLDEFRRQLFQILRDPFLKLPLASFLDLTWKGTVAFYKILTFCDHYRIQVVTNGNITVHHKRFHSLPLMLYDENLTLLFNSYYRKAIFYSHNLKVVRERVVDVLCRMIILKYPFIDDFPN